MFPNASISVKKQHESPRSDRICRPSPGEMSERVLSPLLSRAVRQPSPLGLQSPRLPRVGGPRRCLFGRPDRQATAAAVREAYEEQRKAFAERWGFDVATGEPVAAARLRYLWEKVSSGGGGTETGSGGDGGGGGPGVSASSTAGGPTREHRRASLRIAPYQHLKITDFWKTKKFDLLGKSKSIVPSTAVSAGDATIVGQQ